MKSPCFLRRTLRIDATGGSLVVAFAMTVAPLVHADDQLIVGPDQTIDSTITFDGYDGTTGPGANFIPAGPHYEGDSQRDAVLVNGGFTLTLAEGADVSVKNDDDLTAFLRVGAYGSDGTLLIGNGASLSVGQAGRYANFHIGQGTGTTGTVNQTGGTVTSIGSFNVGVNGGTGTYNLSGGSLIFDNATSGNQTSLISIGFNNATSSVGTSTGNFNIDGGLVELAPVHDGGSIGFIIGNRAKDALAAYNGGEIGTDLAGAGNGIVTQNGGTFRIGAGANLFLSGYGNGTYNLNGGTLEIGGGSLQRQYGNHAGYTADFNLGGGTIKVIGSDLVTGVDANLVEGTVSVIDTNGLNATWSGNLNGQGDHQIDFGGSALVKTGEGALTWSGATRTLDTFAVTGGSVVQSAGDTSAVEFMVGTGAGNTGSYTMNGGTLTVNASTKESDGSAVAGSFRVGDFGGNGTFVQNGGTVSVTENGSLNIGNQGGTGTYTLNDGTLDLGGGLNTLGRSTGSNPASTGTLNLAGGTVNVKDGSSLILANNLNDSALGNGTIHQTGGRVNVDLDSDLYIAGFGSGTYNLYGGTLAVGGDSLHAGYNNAAPDYDFNFGGGTILVEGADLVTDVALNLVDNDPSPTAATQSVVNTNGYNATFTGNATGEGTLVKAGEGTLNLNGSANNLTGEAYVVGGTLRFGAGNQAVNYFGIGSGNGADGTLEVGAGTNLAVSSALQVGDWGGVGEVNQTGGSVGVTGSLNIGNQGGTGTYNLSGGTTTISNGFANLGRSTQEAAGTGTLNLSGTGTFVVGTGGDLIIGDRDGTGADGSGIVNQTGGTLRVQNDGELWIGAHGHGTYNLDGGVLEIGGSSLRANYQTSAGGYAFNLGGGTIKVTGSNLDTSVDAHLTAGTESTIDTNGFDAHWRGDLLADGLHQVDFGGSSLMKTGEGTLTWSGDTRTLDTFGVTGGTVDQTAGDTSAVEFMVGTGTDNTGSYTMNGGTLTVNPSTQESDGSAVAGSFRVGDFGGTGTFTQNAGTVTVTSVGALNIGNQGGHGTYNLNGGVLNLAGGINVLGRSTGSRPASTGVLNLNGGLLNLTNNSSLIVGNNDATAAAGTGAVNQTGGVFHVDAGSKLFISGFGAGSYTLAGGTLEIGGNSLNARYNNTTSAYSFNLNGGTIKVIGSNLNTDVVATLGSATNSTINTNGFDATFGGFYGSGTLTKTGEGVLTSAGGTQIGKLVIQGGSFNAYGGLSVGADGVSVVAGSKFVVNTTLQTTAGGSLNVAGVLNGSGTLELPTNIRAGGVFNAGNSPGSMNVADDFTVESGGTFAWELTDNSTAGSGSTFDFVNLTSGNFTLEDGSVFEILLGGSVNLADGFWDTDQSWTIVGNSGTGTVDAGAVGVTTNFSTAGEGGFTLGTDGNNLVLNWTAVPEPSSLLFLAALAPFAARRRRKS